MIPKEPPKMLTSKEFFALFDESVHHSLQVALSVYTQAEGLVVYENLAMDSSQFGERSALVVGPSNTVASVTDAFTGPPIGDVPSRFKYPVAWCSRAALLGI